MVDRYPPLPGYRAWPQSIGRRISPWAIPLCIGALLMTLACFTCYWMVDAWSNYNSAMEAWRNAGEPVGEKPPASMSPSAFFFLLVFALAGASIPFFIAAMVKGYSVQRSWRRSLGKYTDGERRAFDAMVAHHRSVNLVRASTRSLLAGKTLRGFTPASPFLEPGETAFIDAQCEYARFYGQNVTVNTGSSFAFGSPAFVAGAMVTRAITNAAIVSSAKKQAAAQWRDTQLARTIVTDRRVMVHVQGMHWLSFYYSAVVDLVPVFEQDVALFQFANAEPLRLVGFPASLAAVLTVLHQQGLPGLRSHPAIARWLQQPDLFVGHSSTHGKKSLETT